MTVCFLTGVTFELFRPMRTSTGMSAKDLHGCVKSCEVQRADLKVPLGGSGGIDQRLRRKNRDGEPWFFG